MKKVLTTVLCLVLAISCVAIFVACNNHTHTYSPDWTSDDTYHWHVATCEHTNQVSDKAKHTKVNGICSVCGHVTFNNDVDATTWTAAVAALENLTNYTASMTYQEGDDSITTYVEVKENVAHLYMDGEAEIYYVFTDTVTTHYYSYNGGETWGMYEDDVETNQFANFLADTYEEQLSGMVDSFASHYEDFDYDSASNAYVWKTSDSGYSFSYAIQFVDHSIYSIVINVSDSEGDGMVYTIDKIGTTDFVVAQLHEHNFVWDTVYSDTHSGHCPDCNVYVEKEHDFDEKVDGSKCSICGAVNHEHDYTYGYKPSQDDVDSHVGVCECGVQQELSDGGEPHVYENGSEICSKCGAKKHYHNILWYSISVSWHNGYCDLCEQNISGSHDYNEDVPNSKCSICGAVNHEHVYNQYIPNPKDINTHLITCECGVQSHAQDHVFDEHDDVCDLCGVHKHEHEWVWKNWNGFNENQHELSCTGCDATKYEDHDYDTDGNCKVCGYNKNSAGE